MAGHQALPLTRIGRPTHRALRACRRRPASSPNERWPSSARRKAAHHDLTDDPDLHHNSRLDSGAARLRGLPAMGVCLDVGDPGVVGEGRGEPDQTPRLAHHGGRLRVAPP